MTRKAPEPHKPTKKRAPARQSPRSGIKTGSLVMVAWADAGDLDVDSWSTLEEIEASAAGETLTVSVGWLLVDDEHCVVLAATRIIEEKARYSQVHRIPKSWGLKITKL